MTEHDPVLSKPSSKAGRTQRVVLDLLREHKEAEGGIPTNLRFIFYELEQVGLACKPSPDDGRRNRRRSVGWPPGSQDLTDALTHLREEAVIPWSWIVDETRRLDVWAYSPSVAEYLRDRLEEATISRWGDEPPPLILCESKATAGVLRAIVSPYCCPIAGTGGQVGGFLRTVIAPLLGAPGFRRVLYLGDLDRSGADIEANTRRVLEREAGRELDWTRLGLTEEQAQERGITPIWKVDGRDRKGHWATEVESLGQAGVVHLVRDALDALLPEPLVRVQEREDAEREVVRTLLDGASA